MRLFYFIALAFFSATFLLFGFRLTGLGIWSWVIAGSAFAMVFIYIFFLHKRLDQKMAQVFQKVVYAIMGLGSFMIGLLILRDLFFIPLYYLHNQISEQVYSTMGTLALISCAVLFFVYGFWNAARGPKITQVTIPITKLSNELEEFSIAQISDLHIGSGVDAHFVENVVNLTLSLNPDVIVMTGDIADGRFQQHHKSAQSFSQLSKNKPVLYVTGNHEYYMDGNLWIPYFRSLGLQTLLNQHTVISFRGQKILFAGTLDPAVSMTNPALRPSVSEALHNAPPCDLKILLAHQPNMALQAAPHFDLQISGHTHGGQFFPWNLVIGLFQKFPKGLMKTGSMWVYVNVGSGFWGPKLRFGTRSEISLIRFKRA